MAYSRLRISKHLNLRKFLLLFSFGIEEGLLGPEEAVFEAWGEEEQTPGSLLREVAGVHVAE